MTRLAEPRRARNVVVPLALRPGRIPRGAVQHLRGETMGTTWSLKAPLVVSALPGLRHDIEDLLARLTSELSAWEPNSALSRFNRAVEGWHSLPESLCAVLDRALAIARETGGAYDPTVWPLVELWGFGPRGASDLPDEDDIAAAKRRLGFERIVLDRRGRRAWQPGGVALDVCSSAKGYAIDRVAGLVMDRGIGDFLVEIGGELRGCGLQPDGNPWWVGVETPCAEAQGAAQKETIIALHGLAVATSGDYRRHYTREGRRYTHIIDPRSGYPVANDLVSVTVLHPTCLSADALATALFVLGEKEGLAFAASRWIAALFVSDRHGRLEERMSPAFAAMSA